MDAFILLIHNVRVTTLSLRYIASALFLAFVTLLSILQSSRMLRETVLTMDRSLSIMDVPEASSNQILLDRNLFDEKRQLIIQQQQRRRRGLHIIISHCDQSIEWIWRHYLYKQEYKSMTILSKCNKPPPINQLPPQTTLTTATTMNTTTNATTATTENIPLIQVLTLPNVGRCDHSYAFWIAKLLGEDTDVDRFTHYAVNYTNHPKYASILYNNPTNVVSYTIRDIVLPHDYLLFMKDNDNAYRALMENEIPLHDMMYNIDIVGGGQLHTNYSHTEFSCASKIHDEAAGCFIRDGPNRELASNTAHRNVLWTYRMNEYNSSGGLVQREEESKQRDAFISIYSPMSNWIRYLQEKGTFKDDLFLQHSLRDKAKYDIVPVCFGGNFMTTLRNIKQSPIKKWTSIVESLSRGDNIEEGHYMERLWADILSRPLSIAEQDIIWNQKSRHFKFGAFTGLISLRANQHRKRRADIWRERQAKEEEEKWEQDLIGKANVSIKTVKSKMTYNVKDGKSQM